MKEYNVERHYTAKHSSQFDETLGQARMNLIKHLQNTLKNSMVFSPVTKRIRIGYKTEFNLMLVYGRKKESFSVTENS